MTEQQAGPSPKQAAELLAASSKLYSPSDFELISGAVAKHLEYGPKVDEKDPWKHVAEHFQEIFPAIMEDPAVADVRTRLSAEYDGADVAAISPVAAGIGFAVVFGGAVAIAVTCAIVAYCVEGPHPGKGESAKVSC